MRPHPLRLLLCSALVGAVTLSLRAPAAEPESPVIKINAEAAKANIQVEPLRGGLSMLTGAGGNIVVLATPEGKLMVDAGIALARAGLQPALTRLGPAPVKYVIDTHWHWDHTDGNAWLHEQGATIVAHPNTLARVSRVERVEDWQYTFQPVPPGGRPTQLVEGTRTMRFGGSTLELRTHGRGHTDSDLSVYFREADVLALGDTFWNGVYPFIDNGAGGGIDQAIAWVNAALPQVGEKTLVVPGHGPVGDRTQLVAFRDMLVGVRNNVASLKEQGKTLEQVVAARPTAAYDAKWGQFVIGPAFFTQLVYDGLAPRRAYGAPKHDKAAGGSRTPEHAP